MKEETNSSFQHMYSIIRRFYTRYRRILIIISLTIALVYIFHLLPADAKRQLMIKARSKGAFMGPLLLFSLMALSLLWSTGQQIDSWVFQFININGYRSAWLDSFMNAITQIGNGVLVLFASLILYLLQYRVLAFELISGVLTLGIFIDAIKRLTKRRRPFKQIKQARVVGLMERGLSFPSGHTAQAFFLASFFSQLYQSGAGINSTLYVIAILTGYSRLYIGMHYPRDVLGGAALGIIWGSLFAVFSI